MAASSAASGSNNFTRVASVPNKFPLTIRAWVRRNADRGNYSGWAALNKVGDELFYCGTEVNGDTIDTYFGVSNSSTGDTTLTDAAWHCVTYTFDGATVKVYLAGVQILSVAQSQDAAAATAFTVLSTLFGSWWDGDVEAVAVWEQVLDAAEVLADVDYLEPQMTTDLWAFWPLSTGTDVTDASGNGRDLTIVGTPTTVAGSGTPYAPTPPGTGSDQLGFFALAF